MGIDRHGEENTNINSISIGWLLADNISNMRPRGDRAQKIRDSLFSLLPPPAGLSSYKELDWNHPLKLEQFVHRVIFVDVI